MATLFPTLGQKALQYGAQKVGSFLGIKPKETFKNQEWSQHLAGLRSQLQQDKASVAPVKPPNPATTSVRPAMATPPPKPPVEPFGGIPDAADPAMVGGQKMIDQRMNADVPPPPPVTEAPPSNAPSQLDALRKNYLGMFDKSEDETVAEQSLASVAAKAASDEAAARGAYAKRVGAINEQATLQPFLTGRQRMASGELADQLAALKSGTEAQTLPLSARLAQMQADRENRKTKAEKELGFATPATKDYQTVGEGQSIIDPATGRVVYQGTPKTSTAQPTASIQEYQFAVQNGYKGSFSEYQTEDANRKAAASGTRGVVVGGKLVDPVTGQVIYDGGQNSADLAKTPEAKQLAGIAELQRALGNYQSLIDKYGAASGMTPGARQQLDAAKEAINLAVKSAEVLGALQAPDIALIERMIPDVTREGFFGSLGGLFVGGEARRATDTLGQVTSQYKEKAQTIYDQLVAQGVSPNDPYLQTLAQQLGLTAKTGAPANTPEEAGYQLGPDGLYYPKASSGKPSASTTGSAKSIAAAIKKVESGGNYNARGGSGEFGAYQFMPATWQGWAKQYLGNANAPMTPQNQDTVAEAHISALLAQGKTPEQIALIWNGGQPIRKSGINKYGVKYDSGAYADKVLRAMN